ncbi:hypothetical protein TrispH2_000882 [Trichoplax sp. H2]|nr:hypothetical protein TrispH2_000882 [Trichoplax sp. H2]|eukprot:RDD47560.1 hypothetical protein TrispH2_000882 [Trichoplax sp. H2]
MKISVYLKRRFIVGRTVTVANVTDLTNGQNDIPLATITDSPLPIAGQEDPLKLDTCINRYADLKHTMLFIILVYIYRYLRHSFISDVILTHKIILFFKPVFLDPSKPKIIALKPTRLSILATCLKFFLGIILAIIGIYIYIVTPFFYILEGGTILSKIRALGAYDPTAAIVLGCYLVINFICMAAACIGIRNKNKSLLKWMKLILILLLVGIIAWYLFTIIYRSPLDHSRKEVKDREVCDIIRNNIKYFPSLLVLSLYFVPEGFMLMVIHFYGKRIAET